MFVFIMVATFSLQVVLVEIGGEAVNVVPGGLSRSQWIFCVCAGAGSWVWQILINTMVVIFAPIQFETKESDDIISSARKLPPDVIEAATVTETAGSKWDKVRLGVRRDILYARVFNTSVRSGHKLNKLVRCAETEGKSEEYYKMLAQQMSKPSRLSVRSKRSSNL